MPDTSEPSKVPIALGLLSAVIVQLVFAGACVAVTWWAIGWVADFAGIHLKLLGAVLSIVAAWKLSWGFALLFNGLLVGLLIMVFSNHPDPFAMAKVAGIGVAVGTAFLFVRTTLEALITGPDA